MYERFTDRSRKVMQLANQEAQRFNHEYIGTEHLLLGLAGEGSGVAANVLKNLDIDLRRIRREIEGILQRGPGGEQVVMGRLPHTPRTKKAIEYAIAESQALGHNYVGTEHLLLGLLREQEGVAAQVLMNLGLRLEDVREEVLNLLGHNVLRAEEPPGPSDAAPVAAMFGIRGDINRLSDEQLAAAQELVKRLLGERDELVDTVHVKEAARRQTEADAVMALIAWYVRTLGR